VSSSISCELALRTLAEELREQAGELEQAANVLAALRDSDEQKGRIKEAKAWAKRWMR
jgi:hypothetical protein